MICQLTLATILAAAIALPAIAEKGTNQPLSVQDAKGWAGKPVYSSDGKEVGKVKLLTASAGNKATELRADIANLAGGGAHPIILPATRFSLEGDRVVLDMTAVQASKLPEMKY